MHSEPPKKANQTKMIGIIVNSEEQPSPISIFKENDYSQTRGTPRAGAQIEWLEREFFPFWAEREFLKMFRPDSL